MQILDAVFVFRLRAGEKLAWHGRYHSHGSNEYEIHYFTEGEGSFLSNKAQYRIRPNTLFLSGPREFHSILPQKVTKAITYYAILFFIQENADYELYQLLSDACQNKQQCLEPESVNRFVFEEIMRLALSEKTQLRMSAALLLASHLYRWYGNIGDKNQQKTHNRQAKPAYIKKAIALMEKTIYQKWRIGNLAWELGLSVEHFIRIFKREVKMTPYQYIIRLKAQKAAEMLITTQKTLAQIADFLSFENQFHFSRVFKKCTGLSPSVYRRTYTAILSSVL